MKFKKDDVRFREIKINGYAIEVRSSTFVFECDYYNFSLWVNHKDGNFRYYISNSNECQNIYNHFRNNLHSLFGDVPVNRIIESIKLQIKDADLKHYRASAYD